MFRVFRKREALKRWLLIFFLGAVSISMVVMFTPMGGGDTGEGPANVLASVGGQTITTQDLDRTLRQRMRGMNMDENAQLVAGLAPSMLDQMIYRQALNLQAQKMGIEVTDAEVLRAAHGIPGLYPNGKFVGDAMFQEVTGMTVNQFLASLRQQLLMQKMRALITDGITVTPEEVHQEFLRRNAKARIRYVLFNPGQFTEDVKPTPQDLQKYYAQHSQKYKIPEQRQVRYVIIDQDAIRSQVKVTDAEVQNYYAEHLNDYHVPDRVKVARILFKTSGKTPKEIAAIEKTAQSVLAQLKAGKDFGELAGKYSEDPSAAQGGVVGWIRHGQAVKAFEDAAFSLKPGQISGLIHAEYGIDIIKVLDKQTAHVETFDEVKDQIRAQLEKQKLTQAQSEFAQNLDQQLKSSSQEFAAIAAKAGLQVKETPLFQYKQVVPDFGNNESFADLAFQLRPGEVGQPISVPKGTAIIQLVKSVPEHVPPFEDVRPKVDADYRVAQAPEVASKKAEEFAARAKKGDFKAVARSMGLTVSESKDFTERSSDFIPGVGPGSDLPDAFTLAVGQTSGVVNVSNNRVVFQVLSHTPANEADFAAQKDQIAEQLVEQKRELAFELYEQNLKQQMISSGKLKINDQVMKQYLSTYQHS